MTTTLIRVLRLALTWGWRLLMAWLLLLVILVAGFRVFLGFLPLFHEHAVAYLNDQLNTAFTVDRLDAQWHGGKPSLSLRGLKLQGHDAGEAGFAIDRLDLEVNLQKSLLHLTPILSYLEINGVLIALESNAEGVWSLAGISATEQKEPGEYRLEHLLRHLQRQEYIDLTNLELRLNQYGEKPFSLSTRYLSISEESGLKLVQMGMDAGGGNIELKALGQGVSRRDMDWSGSFVMDDVDLAPVYKLVGCGSNRRCPGKLSRALMNIDSQWDYRASQWQIRGDVWLPYLNYSLVDGKSQVLSLQSGVFMKGGYPVDNAGSWDLWLDSLQMTLAEPSPFSLDIYATARPAADGQGDRVMSVALDRVDLDRLKTFLLGSDLLPELADELMTTLNPSGHVHEVVARFYPERNLLQGDAFELSARLENVSVDAWEDAPSAGNVNGHVRMNAQRGYLDLDASDFSLGLTELFRDVWHYKTATARLYWDVVDDIYRLRSDDIALRGEEGSLKGRLNLDIPLSDGPSTMALTVGMTDGDAIYTPKYLPSKLNQLPDDLVDWLDNSIKGARVNAGGFLYNGVLSDSGGDLDSRWGLFFDVEQAHLDYDPDWPEVRDLRGQVYVNDDRVEVSGQSARALNADLENILAKVLLDDDPVLTVTGLVRGSGSDAMAVLTKTPVDQALEGAARNWQITGLLTSDLNLSLPFERVDDVQVDVSILADDAVFALAEPEVRVEGIQGRINYSTDTGLHAENVQARFLGEAINASIRTDLQGGVAGVSQFSWSGHIGAEPLQHWLDMDWLSLLEGRAAYRGALTIPFGNGPLRLSIESDLKGIEFELPRPLGIPAEASVPLQLTTKIYPGSYDLSLALGEMGHLRMLLGEGYTLDSAAVRFGSTRPLPQMETGRIIVSGNIPEIDLDPWVEKYGGQPVDEDEKSMAALLQVNGLSIGRLTYDDFSLDDLNISLLADDHYTRVIVDSESIAGRLAIPERPTQPYKLRMDRLHLPAGDENTEGEGDPLAEVMPYDLPDADVVIKSLKMGDQDFGKVAFSLRSVTNGKTIQGIKGTLGGMEFNGHAEWQYENGEHRTLYSGKLEGGDIERFQETMGIPPIAAAERSEIKGRVIWQGSPLDTNLKSLDGS
ncbi:MAG: YhdP family phospholipid transporter, partial [Endozoicomonas sp.]